MFNNELKSATWWMTASDDDKNNAKVEMLELGFSHFEECIGIVESISDAQVTMKYSPLRWWKIIDDIIEYRLSHPESDSRILERNKDFLECMFFVNNKDFLLKFINKVNDQLLNNHFSVWRRGVIPWYQYLMVVFLLEDTSHFVVSKDLVKQIKNTCPAINNLHKLLLYAAGYSEFEMVFLMDATVNKDKIGFFECNKSDVREIEPLLKREKSPTLEECSIMV